MAKSFFTMASLLLGLASMAAAVKLRNGTDLASAAAQAGNMSFHVEASSALPCQCVANSPAWVATSRTVPKCIFIDLGAADGNTFHDFLNNKYGPVANCPSGQWEAYLVEANPQFDAPLKALEAQYPGQVHAITSTAAFTCQGQTSFFIDTDPTHNHWGSSMSGEAPDAVKSGKQKVTVPTLNVNQLIAQSVTAADWVMLKVDIEGAEYEVVPCLSNYPNAGLVDRMYLEDHWWFKTESPTTKEQMDAAKAKLASMHVDIPAYYSNTL